MAFCSNCGTQIENQTKFCPGCGAAQAPSPAPPPQAPQPPPAPWPPPAEGPPAGGPPENPVYTPPVMPGAPQQADIRDAQDNRTMAWLAYILFFIPLLTGAHKTSPFAKFHTNQGTALFIASAVYGIAYGILSLILAFIPVVGWILILILGIASVIFPIFCVVGIINAVNGKMQPLPVIGGMQIIK